MHLPSLALVGKQGSGKTSIARALVDQHAYAHHSWADPVRQIFEMAYGEITNYSAMKGQLFQVTNADGTRSMLTGREILQKIGTEALRDHVDQEFWIKAGIRRLWRPVMMVNDDTRFLNEANALRAHGWSIVRVIASDTIRKERLGNAYQMSNHPSEKEQESIKEDYFLDNENRTVKESVDELIAWLSREPTDLLSLSHKAATRD